MIPQLNTILAAYGSTKILNYAEGDQFPKPIAPPIIVIVYIYDNIYGNALIKIAKFVIAPVTTKFILFLFYFIFSYILYITLFYIHFLFDFFNIAPSKPDYPCISGAVFNYEHNGVDDPLYTGILLQFIYYKIFNVFCVVFYIVELHADVEIPIKFILSCKAANMIASISSWPGSQSSHTSIFYIFWLLDNRDRFR